MYDLTRRQFLITAGATWISPLIGRPGAAAAAEASGDPEFFTDSEWLTVEAMTGRIIPTDDLPGAIEAHCVNFIDKALVNEDAGAAGLYRSALAEFHRLVDESFDQAFPDLDTESQDALLSQLQGEQLAGWDAGDAGQAAFFNTVWSHTILGFLSDPKYGGNRDFAGWRVAGYPGHMHHLGGVTPAQMIGDEKIPTVWGEKI